MSTKQFRRCSIPSSCEESKRYDSEALSDEIGFPNNRISGDHLGWVWEPYVLLLPTPARVYMLKGTASPRGRVRQHISVQRGILEVGISLDRSLSIKQPRQRLLGRGSPKYGSGLVDWTLPSF